MALELTTQTVALLELSEKQALSLIDGHNKMPPIIICFPDGGLDGTYILPPIKYPDGKYYLKLGHHDLFEETVRWVFDEFTLKKRCRHLLTEPKHLYKTLVSISTFLKIVLSPVK